MTERFNVPNLAPPPGYSHVAVAPDARLVFTAGASGDDVLKTTVYVASGDRADLLTAWDLVQESDVAAAASTLLGVSLLGYEGQLVEIEAVAVSGR